MKCSTWISDERLLKRVCEKYKPYDRYKRRIVSRWTTYYSRYHEEFGYLTLYTLSDSKCLLKHRIKYERKLTFYENDTPDDLIQYRKLKCKINDVLWGDRCKMCDVRVHPENLLYHKRKHDVVSQQRRTRWFLLLVFKRLHVHRDVATYAAKLVKIKEMHFPEKRK